MRSKLSLAVLLIVTACAKERSQPAPGASPPASTARSPEDAAAAPPAVADGGPARAASAPNASAPDAGAVRSGNPRRQGDPVEVTGTGDFPDDGSGAASVGMQGGWDVGGPAGPTGSGKPTIGRVPDTGSGYEVRGGGDRDRPYISMGTLAVTGDLDKAVVRRYVRQKLPRIEYCYQKQLVTNPKLAGTVRTKFTIGAAGTVTEVHATGSDDRALEGCLEETIRSIQFPKPDGGGVAAVTCPFTFRPTSK